MKLVQACFEDLESSFHHCGSLMKLVQNCLSAREDLESSFYHCGGSVQACLIEYQGRSRKQFLLRSCEARGGLFKCRDGQMKPF